MNLLPSAHRGANVPANASPATINVLIDCRSGCSGKPASTAGGTVACVILYREMARASLSPASTDPRGGMYNAAPRQSAIITSEKEASKLNDANCTMRLWASTAKPRICSITKLHNPLCSILNPFGLPVEPEV